MSFLRTYHLRYLVLVQYLSQITSVYGVNDSKGFLNAKVKVTFTLNDRDDADYFSKSLGQKTITVTNKGFNSGGSQSGSTTTKKLTTQSQPLIRPESLMTLSKKEGVALFKAWFCDRSSSTRRLDASYSKTWTLEIYENCI